MRFRLRTLLIAATIGPPILAGAWFVLVQLVVMLDKPAPPVPPQQVNVVVPALGPNPLDPYDPINFRFPEDSAAKP